MLAGKGLRRAPELRGAQSGAVGALAGRGRARGRGGDARADQSKAQTVRHPEPSIRRARPPCRKPLSSAHNNNKSASAIGRWSRHWPAQREDDMTIRSTRREFLGATASASALLLTGAAGIRPAHAQYPERNLSLIVPYGAGGGTDVTARLLAKDLEPVIGKPVTVENRAGGGGWIGWGALAAAKPDGYTLGYLNVPEHVCGLSRSADRPQGTARELHADHQPRDRLQCVGGESRQPVQDREGRHRRGEETAEHHHRDGLRRRQRRPYRDPRASRPRPAPSSSSSTQRARPRPRPRRSAVTSTCWARM